MSLNLLNVRLFLSLIFFFLTSGSVLADMELLPKGKGRELVYGSCSPCHSIRLVTQNRMTRKGWDEAITWMQETQNLWPIAPPMRNKILDYLVKYFGPESRSSSDQLPMRPRVNPLPKD